MQRYSYGSGWDLIATRGPMTASHFHSNEVVVWQLHAATLTAIHWGFPVGLKKGSHEQRYGYESSAALRASAEFRRTSCARRCLSENLHG